MELLTLVSLLLVTAVFLVKSQQRTRIHFLASYLSKYRVEGLMADLMQGYLRALGESDEQRQAAVFGLLDEKANVLCVQLNAFVLAFSAVDEALARVSRLPVALPFAAQWKATTFDLRKLLSVHAHGITEAANSAAGDPKQKAFVMMAELMLLQHTCHWFCRSKLVASARLLAGHKTPYQQVLTCVAPSTRRAYGAVVGQTVLGAGA